MSDETELLKKRFIELSKKSYAKNIFTFTSFLGLAEQSAFSAIKSQLGGSKYELFGGVDGAERQMVRFGDPEELGYEVPFPIVTLRAEPANQRFADKLTHRDFLGAILNLGIERDTLGDIVIRDNVGYIFAEENIAQYILSELVRVKHTDIRLTICDEPPTGELYKTEMRRIQINSERLDAVVARVFSLSREDAQSLFSKRLVFADSRCIESASYTPHVGERISVRGYGRMVYRGFESNAKKGKLNVQVEVYI